jgi:DNA-binding response OmpR family regulator
MAKILIVDDEPLIAMMLSEWLVEQGLEPLGPAHSEAEAFDLLKGDSGPDAAILDVSLGDSDCFAIADALQARGVPFAFATGHGSEAVAREYRGVMTLTKPFDFEAVRGVVMRLIGTAV